MVKTYRLLAYIICALVAVQAAMHAWGSAGISKYVMDGGVIDKSSMEGEATFTEVIGLIVHSINGMMVIPLVAVAMLVVAFLARFPGAVRMAAIVLGLVALQVLLGMYGHGMTFLALLHGLNALVLFAFAYIAATRMPRADGQYAPEREKLAVR